MAKSGIDQHALIDQFAHASARQTAQLRQAVTDATLKALQGREMTLKNIRGVVKSVSEAASAGAAQNAMPKVDVEKMLATAVAGIDDALLKAVEANRVALSRFVDQGVGLQEKQLQKALSDLEKFEDTMFAALKKSASGAGSALEGPWQQVLEKFQAQGSLAGAQAHATADQMADQMQQALREGRAVGLKAAQALAQSYTALVSGVLMGLSDALRAPAAPAPEAAPAPAAKAARKR
jgi:hypothetical protein